MDIEIPNNWTPRAHQVPCFQAADMGIKRQYLIWHRRAGKDSFALNYTATQLIQDVGTYWHLFPKQTQARKAIWTGINNQGVKVIDQAFPKELRDKTLSQDMAIHFKNKSVWQLCGSDNYDSLVGSNPKGVVFSEWALCDPASWDYIRPILKENDGWAIFITTYRGKNHAYRMMDQVRDNPNWYVSVKTVDDTVREDGVTPVFSKEAIQEERDEGMSEAMINQEYYCLPQLAIDGSYYVDITTKMREDGCYSTYDYNPSQSVYAVFDLGFSDHMTCIFFQQQGNQIVIIGSRYWRFTTLTQISVDIKNSFPWGKAIEKYILPKDANAQHMTAPGVDIDYIDKGRVHAGIELVKDVLPRMRFDVSIARPWLTEAERLAGPNNAKLVDAVDGYHTEKSKDADADYYKESPAHTWHSHYADALRYLVLWVHNGGFDNENWGKAPDNSRKIRGTI